MFEIRIICDRSDTDRITDALSQAFTIGPVHKYPTRGSERLRLYVTADHHSNTGPWPSPEEAYALAPSILSEIGWTGGQAANQPYGRAPRDFWLRKAALLDRIALQDVSDDAAEAATWEAERLMSLDDAGVICEPRHYVRQQYAHWINNQ
ncbi:MULTISPECIES: hypothetical protein [unclassified Streptomyces]|uniref:hypothetical protein n=1 Tax=unclassified Streptomyces TaxID=2593676 RepID=UPI0023654684|nr:MULTISPECIES: hypothetical protein [unclassified Streptomyces]MDF3140078.1 hypothetical protein [Streptomyces sp. T21Q-yed]WDF40159.1 hypothetical protein PBV52_26920 [Streptomyces sp. T12]